MLILVKTTYSLTNSYPKGEIFALTSQMRRASISIVSNFAEGYLRSTPKDKHHYLTMSQGSLHELEAQIDISLELNYLSETQHRQFTTAKDHVGALLYKYKAKLST